LKYKGAKNMFERKKIKPEHKKILNKLRELYIQSGGKPLYEPEDFGLNELFKSEEGMEIDFDYGVPHELHTPDGSYMILGSNVVGDVKKFWNLLDEAFDIEIIKPKRDDRKISELDLQLKLSGPIIRIREKGT
jgi:hypothetical protein